MARKSDFYAFDDREAIPHSFELFATNERRVGGKNVPNIWGAVAITDTMAYWCGNLSPGTRNALVEVSEAGSLVHLFESGTVKIIDKALVKMRRADLGAVCPGFGHDVALITDTGKESFAAGRAKDEVATYLAEALLPGYETVEVGFASRGFFSKEVKERGATTTVYRMPGTSYSYIP